MPAYYGLYLHTPDGAIPVHTEGGTDNDDRNLLREYLDENRICRAGTSEEVLE